MASSHLNKMQLTWSIIAQAILIFLMILPNAQGQSQTTPDAKMFNVTLWLGAQRNSDDFISSLIFWVSTGNRTFFCDQKIEKPKTWWRCSYRATFGQEGSPEYTPGWPRIPQWPDGLRWRFLKEEYHGGRTTSRSKLKEFEIELAEVNPFVQYGQYGDRIHIGDPNRPKITTFRFNGILETYSNLSWYYKQEYRQKPYQEEKMIKRTALLMPGIIACGPATGHNGTQQDSLSRTNQTTATCPGLVEQAVIQNFELHNFRIFKRATGTSNPKERTCGCIGKLIDPNDLDPYTHKRPAIMDVNETWNCTQYSTFEQRAKATLHESSALLRVNEFGATRIELGAKRFHVPIGTVFPTRVEDTKLNIDGKGFFVLGKNMTVFEGRDNCDDEDGCEFAFGDVATLPISTFCDVGTLGGCY
jgi:hypothetical protein